MIFLKTQTSPKNEKSLQLISIINLKTKFSCQTLLQLGKRLFYLTQHLQPFLASELYPLPIILKNLLELILDFQLKKLIFQKI
ncbi:MAG: hypothetical protein ACI976_000608 [Aureispira sp.]|jgi:hypothetical protein